MVLEENKRRKSDEEESHSITSEGIVDVAVCSC